MKDDPRIVSRFFPRLCVYMARGKAFVEQIVNLWRGDDRQLLTALGDQLGLFLQRSGAYEGSTIRRVE